MINLLLKSICSNHILEVEYDKKHNEYYFNFWGFSKTEKISWISKIKWILHIIKSGSPCIMLSPEQMIELEKFITTSRTLKSTPTKVKKLLKG